MQDLTKLLACESLLLSYYFYFFGSSLRTWTLSSRVKFLPSYDARNTWLVLMNLRLRVKESKKELSKKELSASFVSRDANVQFFSAGFFYIIADVLIYE